MAIDEWVSLGGTARRYQNKETGEIISRWRYEKMRRGMDARAIAKLNRQRDLATALSRPARGRTKARTQAEIDLRLEIEAERQKQREYNRLLREANKRASRIKLKKIRPQLLKTGRRAERIPFADYAQYVELFNQLQSARLASGRRYITAYGIGVVGVDERPPNGELTATLFPMVGYDVMFDEDEFNDAVSDFAMEHSYFILSHFYMHIHFDREYAENRLARAQRKNIPSRR